MEAVYCCLSRSQVDAFSLVLSSTNIDHMVKEMGDEWYIFVETADIDSAREHIALYLKENQSDKSQKALPAFYRPKTLSAMWMALILIVIHIAIDNSQYQNLFVQYYGASAEKINNGEFYRTVTALFLHADYSHLLGNISGLLLFGTALFSLTGWGVGWFMIILSGTLGNLINSYLYKTNHISIGFSTALFGIIGILATYALIPHIKKTGFTFKAFLPMGGGLSLMAIMGASPHSDITAHFFGFVIGVLLGLGYGLDFPKPLSKGCQFLTALIVAGVILFSLLQGYRIK